MKSLLLITVFNTCTLSLLANSTADSLKVKMKLVDDLASLELKTGDLVFFQSKTFNGTMTQIGTMSPFTHSSMVVILEDGTIGLTHATDNDYHGFRIPLIEEAVARNGVILTRLDDLFISTDKGKNGFYRSIWIRKIDEDKVDRPALSEILSFYNNNKHLPFEPSNLQFILTAFDLRINGRDYLQARADNKIMCSEYLCMLYESINFPLVFNETANEISPSDLYDLIEDYYLPPVVYRFGKGSYQQQ